VLSSSGEQSRKGRKESIKNESAKYQQNVINKEVVLIKISRIAIPRLLRILSETKLKTQNSLE